MKKEMFIIEYRSNEALLFLALLTTCYALRDKTRYIKVGKTFWFATVHVIVLQLCVIKDS